MFLRHLVCRTLCDCSGHICDMAGHTTTQAKVSFGFRGRLKAGYIKWDDQYNHEFQHFVQEPQREGWDLLRQHGGSRPI